MYMWELGVVRALGVVVAITIDPVLFVFWPASIVSSLHPFPSFIIFSLVGLTENTKRSVHPRLYRWEPN